MTNPYTSRGPLQDASMFFGRTYELNELATFLGGNQSISIVGPRKMGKTSLMLHLMRPETIASVGIGLENLFVYTDCQELSICQQAEIFAHLCTGAAAALHARGLEPEHALKVAVSNPTWSAFDQALRKLNQRGLRVVFMLDEFEQLTVNPNIDVSFYNALRSAVGRLRVAYVTVSAQPLIELTYFDRSKKILSSPFFNIFTQLFLGLLSPGESGGLIRNPMAGAGITVSNQLEKFIYQLVGGHPLALQIACFHAFEDPQDYPKIEQHTAQEIEAHFQYYWHNLSSAEQDLLAKVGKGILLPADDPSHNVLLRSLVRKCLLVPSQGQYTFPSKVWAEFVSAQQSSSLPPPPIDPPRKNEPVQADAPVKPTHFDLAAQEPLVDEAKGKGRSLQKVMRESLPEAIGGIVVLIVTLLITERAALAETVKKASAGLGQIWLVLLILIILVALIALTRAILRRSQAKPATKKPS